MPERIPKMGRRISRTTRKTQRTPAKKNPAAGARKQPKRNLPNNPPRNGKRLGK